MSSLAAFLCIYIGALGAGYVLEQLLDQIDVGKDHAAAAVALETDAVERFTIEPGWSAEGLGRRRNMRMCGMVVFCDRSGLKRPCKVDRRRGKIDDTYASSMPSLRSPMYFSQRSPVTCAWSVYACMSSE